MNEFGTFDMEMLGINQDQIKEVDSSEAEVVSRVLMSRIKDIHRIRKLLLKLMGIILIAVIMVTRKT